jgi:hypothetical protein
MLTFLLLYYTKKGIKVKKSVDIIQQKPTPFVRIVTMPNPPARIFGIDGSKTCVL